MKPPRPSAAPSGRLKISISSRVKIDRRDEAADDRAAPGRRVVGFRGRRCGASAPALWPRRGCGVWRAACGVDPAALGPLVLLAPLLLGLGHGSNLVGRGGQPPLDRVSGGVEAADRHVRGIAGEGRLGKEADQLRLERAGPERRGQLPDPLDDGRRAGPRAGRGRWSRPGRGRCESPRPIARTPARPPPDSRRPAATARAISTSALSSSRLKAASGGRAVTRVAPALGCGSGGAVVGAQLAALHPQPELGEAAVAEVGALGALGRGGQVAVEEDRDAERADPGGERLRPPPRPRRDRPASSQTSGQTSSAPTAGCRPR